MHTGIISSLIVTFLLSSLFTFFIIFLSKRLSQVYFVVGTLALYILSFQVALNRESLTWWALWLSWIQRILRQDFTVTSLPAFLLLSLVCVAIFLWTISSFKKALIFTTLKWWWEGEHILQTLGIRIPVYTFVMVLISSACAVVWWTLYTFYYMYIDPRSFWLNMLVLTLVIAFISYNQNEFITLLIAVGIVFIYEYLRFFKIVEPAQLGYIREACFALIIMIATYITFRKISFGRLY